MDSAQANTFAKILEQEIEIDGWVIRERLGEGKSAIVMRAEKGGLQAAVKVFHPESVERYGLNVQKMRIDREKMLIEKGHPNLVPILDGGVSTPHGRPYIVMGIVNGPILSNVLANVPRSNIAKLIEQLARAAKHLEDMGVVHRDIKPDNIKLVEDHNGILCLMDCGVIRPIGDNSGTDQGGMKQFVGTHQYSPPEMLHRTEEDSIEGWRAVTFYQIGAVLHDLIMLKGIFSGHVTPNANLINAVDSIDPVIESPDVEPMLISLAKRCLLKRPVDRLRLLKWEDFFFSEIPKTPNLEERKKLINQRQRLKQASESVKPLDRSENARLVALRHDTLAHRICEVVASVTGSLSDTLPPRNLKITTKRFPDPVVHCSFPADNSLNFSTPFHFEFSIKTTPDSPVIEVHARAGKGEKSNEIGWTHVGNHLDDFSTLNDALNEWVINILEQLVD